MKTRDLILSIFLTVGLIFSSNSVKALSPDDCCKQHDEALEAGAADGACEACGDKCIRITGNTGIKIYKKAGESQCSITNDCKNDCPDCGCETQ